MMHRVGIRDLCRFEQAKCRNYSTLKKNVSFIAPNTSFNQMQRMNQQTRTRSSSVSKAEQETSQPLPIQTRRMDEREFNVKGKNNIVDAPKTEPVVKPKGAWTKDRGLFRPSPLFSITTSPASGSDLSSINRDQVDL